ncbi:nudix-type domain-containing protein 6 [Salpingoeca rosetta]|uniref:Nudix-type domain-containing protein 6 n=1 Tax=Salpingoeca rosetta (strain ATCC 50818 / BSB-021) TaxID=946362 RepID=F2U277_SALR5|nr:nudix-type domain-containing protein 6 [Salpingoeca rosetta]EGD81729.1 nudix-type domain-containing protein 6 [Salpingoeca rosetta]|eukprot:XP_004996933.1 nudix-type domain-containing protein 6 [Salpingoeca rosetta]
MTTMGPATTTGMALMRTTLRRVGYLSQRGGVAARAHSKLAAPAVATGATRVATSQQCARALTTRTLLRMRPRRVHAILSSVRMLHSSWRSSNGGSTLSEATENKPFDNVDVDCSMVAHLNQEQFAYELSEAVSHWRQNNVAAAWLTVPVTSAWMATVANEEGFVLHHARKGIIKMLRWLDESRPCQVPPYNTHQVAVAGLIINERKEVLAIKEKIQRVAGYKLPGGRADPGENFGEAAVREVFEETGIRSRFHSVVGIRHMHGFRHGASDIYVICRCIPESEEITMCEDELSEARWMPLEDYIDDTMPLNQIFMHNIKRSVDAARGRHNEVLLDVDLPEIVMPSPYRANQLMHFYHAGGPRPPPSSTDDDGRGDD